MSIQAVAWVLEHSEAALADRLVLIAIANHADARGWNAWPAVPLIAAEARVDRATVFRAITALEDLGEIHVERRPGRPNLYGIPALMGSHPAMGKGSQIATGGVASTRQRGRRLPPEPSLTVKEPSAAFEKCRVCGQPAPPGHGRCDDCVENGEEKPWASKERSIEWARAIRNGQTPA